MRSESSVFGLGLLGTLLSIGAGCDQSVALGLPPDDAAVASSDAAPISALDIAGTWRHCRMTLRFNMDGTFDRSDTQQPCRSHGHYSVVGSRLDMSVETSDCASIPAPVLGAEVVRDASGLALVSTSFSDGKIFLADGASPHARWRLIGQPGVQGMQGDSHMRLVGVSGAAYASGCYWSADGKCGGFLSCQGSVANWSTNNGAFLVSTNCSGGCPCATVINAKANPDGSYAGQFFAASCAGTITGTITMTPEPDTD